MLNSRDIVRLTKLLGGDESNPVEVGDLGIIDTLYGEPDPVYNVIWFRHGPMVTIAYTESQLEKLDD